MLEKLLFKKSNDHFNLLFAFSNIASTWDIFVSVQV